MQYQIFSIGLICIVFVVSVLSQSKNICFKAKTCIHDGNEKCGEDKDGNVRRFFDTCDIMEYNCLRKTDYVKASMEKCIDLPPIEETEKPEGGKQDDNVNPVLEKADGNADIGEAKGDEDSAENARKSLDPGTAAIISKYWCWRAKYCHVEGGDVCARDRRLNQKKTFRSACDVYKHNCYFGSDFTVTDPKVCK